MKKLFAMLLSIVLILSTISIPAFAETESPTRDDVVFEVENIIADPGSDVSVAFTVAGEYEAHALTVAISYDASMLSVVGTGLTEGDIWQTIADNGGSVITDATVHPGQIPLMAIMPSNSFSGSGTIFTMNFHVDESVEPGTIIPIELEVMEFNYMPIEQTVPTPIPFTANNGSITASAQHGDVALNVANITATPGTDVSVAFTIEGEYEAHALTFVASYDASMLSVNENGLTQGDICQTILDNGGMVVADATSHPGEAVFMGIAPTVTFGGNGTIFTINFHVDESVPSGTVIPIELEVREFYYMAIGQSSSTPISFTANNGSITAEIYHTVTFVDWDGTVLSTQSVLQGTDAVEPTVPEREGYTFTGWDVDFTNVQSDLTVTAQYEINTYTITYTVNGQFYATQTYEYGAAIIAPTYDVPEGHTFSGWDVPATMPSHDLTLDATLTINVYEVTLIDGLTGDVITVLAVEYGHDAVLPVAPEHEGYVFGYWDGDATNVTEDRTLTAIYWMIGDVNNDGEITAADALLIMRYALGLEIEGNTLVMDVNGDGRIDSMDALLALRISMGVA